MSREALRDREPSQRASGGLEGGVVGLRPVGSGESRGFGGGSGTMNGLGTITQVFRPCFDDASLLLDMESSL